MSACLHITALSVTLTLINYILTRIKEQYALEVSLFEFNGYSVQRSVRSAMCALKLNKPHNYK